MIQLSWEINRFEGDDKQTLGILNVIGRNFSCKTLEPPDLGNQQNISCIPAGTYIVKKRSSLKYPFHFWITNVQNRDKILVHNGNRFDHTEGCILVGESHVDIDSDGYRDVTNSKNTLAKLYAMMPNEFKLTIK